MKKEKKKKDAIEKKDAFEKKDAIEKKEKKMLQTYLTVEAVIVIVVIGDGSLLVRILSGITVLDIGCVSSFGRHILGRRRLRYRSRSTSVSLLRNLLGSVVRIVILGVI